MYSPSINYLGIHRQKAILPMVESPTCALQIICTGPWCVDWGDGIVETYAGESVRHNYSTPFTGEVKIWAKHGALTLIKEVHLYDNGVPEAAKSNYVITPGFFQQFPKVESIGWNSTGLKCKCNGDFAAGLPASVKSISIGRSTPSLTDAVFDIDNLPADSQLTFINSSYVPGAPCVITGDIANLNKEFKSINLNTNPNTLYGKIENLPQSLTYFRVNGSNTIAGDIGNVSLPNLTYFAASGKNEITGNIGELAISKSLNKSWSIGGKNKIYGNVQDISGHITSLLIGGENTITGNIGLLKNPNLASLLINGKNTIGGSIDTVELSSSGTNIEISGINSISGDIKYLPHFRTAIIFGNNELYGDIKDIPMTYTSLSISGKNRFRGNIVDLPSNISNFSILGDTIISGNINTLTDSKNLEAITIGGQNSITGNVNGITSQKLSYLSIAGKNTIIGDFGSLADTKLAYISLSGNASINTYTSHNWNGKTVSELYLRSSGHNLTSGQVDQILIDMANSDITWSGNKRLYLDGINIKTRTQNSNSAFDSLKQKGVSILPNKII
ncbi:hypothetical protein PQ459_04865 [Chryseobacterium sp. KACC 21268]|nr:hypothetical protein PQ459_04865 [Chryseobacterium sp. KACC 21268]